MLRDPNFVNFEKYFREPSGKTQYLRKGMTGVACANLRQALISLDYKIRRGDDFDDLLRSTVAQFQQDDNCRLFLLSLKAGGSGLNLTAAGYVFLLDPWWNPAVEAQAIDRAHRIGQQKPVMAYRLVATDTVEERILSLQEKKRALADSILSGDESVLRTLTREDLEALLG